MWISKQADLHVIRGIQRNPIFTSTDLHVAVHLFVEFFLKTFQVDSGLLVNFVLVGIQDIEVSILQQRQVETI